MSRINNLSDLQTKIEFLKEKTSLQEQLIKNDLNTVTGIVKYPLQFVEESLNKRGNLFIHKIWDFLKSKIL